MFAPYFSCQLKRRAISISPCSSSSPTTPIMTMAMMMFSTLRLFHSFQIQKPILSRR
jgi:hypothetical protein